MLWRSSVGTLRQSPTFIVMVQRACVLNKTPGVTAQRARSLSGAGHMETAIGLAIP
jgi:hypothetical protein